MGLFKRKNKEVQTAPLINLPGIKLPTLLYDDVVAKAKLDKLNMDSLETAQNKTMRYLTRATQDVSLEDMATRLGIDSNQLLEWNQGSDLGFKQGDIINLNLTNDLGRALMKSVDELRAENERRAAERQEYANRDDVKQYGFMRGLTGELVMNTFRTKKDFNNENARVKHNTAVESDIIANDQRQAVRNRRDWGPMQFDDGTSELTSKQFVGDIQDAMNTAGEYGLKFAGAIGGAMALPTLILAVGGQGLANTALRTGYNIGKDMIIHPIQNFIAPQLASKGIETGIDFTNKTGLTDISDKSKELISTSGGFTLGGLGVGYLKNKAGKLLLDRGLGHLVESGSGTVSKILENQLRTPYMSGLTTEAIGSNFNNFVLPNLAPGAMLGLSYHYTNKSIGDNISDLTGGVINTDAANMIAEGLSGVGASLYVHNFWANAAKMSGGKKGFHNNKEYFLNYGAGKGSKFREQHPILNTILAFKNLIGLTPPRNAAYLMTTRQGTKTLTGTTNYAPAGKEGIVTDVNYLDTWFDGNNINLNGEGIQVGSVMVGNKNTSSGNMWERLVKSLGGNDGRFDNGQIAHIYSAADADKLLMAIEGASFLNPKTRTYDPIMLNGDIHPDLSGAIRGDRSNVLINSTFDGNRHIGTMLDIDGNLTIPIKTKDGRFMDLFIDTAGPGTGAGKTNSLTDQASRIMSRTTSHQLVPGYWIGLTGRKQLIGNASKTGTKDVGKVRLPWTAAENVDRRVLTYENIGGGELHEDGSRAWNPILESMYGETLAWKDITSAKIAAIEDAAKKGTSVPTHRGVEIVDGVYELPQSKTIEAAREARQQEINKQAAKDLATKNRLRRKIELKQEQSLPYWDNILSLSDFNNLYNKKGLIALPKGWRRNRYIPRSYFDALPLDVLNYIILSNFTIYKQGGKIGINQIGI